MENIFANIDIPKVLGYGLSGLSLLLMILAYGLLRKAIAMHHPDKGVLSLIKFYVVMTLLVIIAVGGFSIPIAKRNSDLGNDNERLNKQSKAFVLADNIRAETDSIRESSNTDQIRHHLSAIRLASDSLTALLPSIDPSFREDSVSLRNELRMSENNFNNLVSSDPSNAAARFQPHAALLHTNLNAIVIQSLKKYVVK